MSCFIESLKLLDWTFVRFSAKCSLEEIISFSIFVEDVKLERQESVSIFFITVNHDASEDWKLSSLWSPIHIVNFLEEFIDDLIHLVRKRCHLIFALFDLVNSISNHVFDTIHLEIEISTEFACFINIMATCIEGTNSRSTCCCRVFDTSSVDLTDSSILIYSNMWCK